MPSADVSRGSVRALVRAFLDALDDAALNELAHRLHDHLEADTVRLLDAREAADRLRLHPETVSRMARTGRISAVKVGREWRFHADALDVQPADRPRAIAAGRLVAAEPRPRHEVERPSVAAIRGRV
jgi:excisionase family DNA binding protein